MCQHQSDKYYISDDVPHDADTRRWMCNGQLVGSDLLQLLYPAPQTVHLDALLAVLHLQLRDGLFLLGAVELDFLQGGTHRAKLLLQGRHMLLLLRGNKRWK